MSYSLEELKNYLNSIKNEENSELIEEYLEKIENLDGKDLDKKIKGLGDSKEEIENSIVKVINFKLANRFKQLNDLISYGITDTTLHIHVVPKSVVNMINKKGQDKANKNVIDALIKIRNKLLSDSEFDKIERVIGVSPLLRISKLQRNFKNLGFEVEETHSQRFKEMFPDAKKIMEVSISREKICSKEWIKSVTSIREDIDDKE